MVKSILFLFIIFIIPLSSNEKVNINFSPLPMKKKSQTLKEFLPLISYLKEKIDIDIIFKNKNAYDEIIKDFSNEQIDMAYLGPLPLVKLNNQYKHMKPIVTIKQSNGKKYYKCALAKFKKDKLDLKNLKVALTQSLSTCGYFMSEKLLKEKYGININEVKFDYKMSHSNAILSILEDGFSIAGAKGSIIKKHESLGIETILESELLPGFSIVVNTKTLSKKQIKLIQNTILNIPKSEYKNWKGVLSNGFEKASIKDYENIKIDFDSIPKKGNF